jgi:hypothetical protein
MPNDGEPQVYLTGGTDELWLDEAGRSFKPGDAMPRTLTAARRASLQQAGIRFETRHPEPEPKRRAPDETAHAATSERAEPEPRPAAKKE